MGLGQFSMMGQAMCLILIGHQLGLTAMLLVWLAYFASCLVPEIVFMAKMLLVWCVDLAGNKVNIERTVSNVKKTNVLVLRLYKLFFSYIGTGVFFGQLG